jgi:YD repeat-containing protein
MVPGRYKGYGNRSGITGSYLYDGTGKCTGIKDRTGSQVLWFEYSGDLLAAGYDATNRRVEYGYSGGKLESVKDVLGLFSRYQYDSKARLNQVTDAAGRLTLIGHDEYGNVASVLDSDNKGYRFEFDYDQGRKESYARVIFPGGEIGDVPRIYGFQIWI